MPRPFILDLNPDPIHQSQVLSHAGVMLHHDDPLGPIAEMNAHHRCEVAEILTIRGIPLEAIQEFPITLLDVLPEAPDQEGPIEAGLYALWQLLRLGTTMMVEY